MGHATHLGEADLDTDSGITVLSPRITQDKLVGPLVAAPNPFTPNGDGINERIRIEFDVLAITSAADISVHIHDLSGNLIRRLFKGSGLSGHYNADVLPTLNWNGRDSGGHLVPPGIYLLRVAVDGDARQSQRLRGISVTY